jgi:hypothetical protein
MNGRFVWCIFITPDPEDYTKLQLSQHPGARSLSDLTLSLQI